MDSSRCSYCASELTNSLYHFLKKGIYLDCYIEGDFDGSGKFNKLHCGTYKTLRDVLEEMQTLGELSGSLTYYNTKYVNENINRYTAEGEPDEEDSLCMLILMVETLAP